MRIWAFNKAEDDKAREMIYKSLLKGKSRFGWSQKDEHNLKLENNWTEWHSKQLFLLQIKKDDWIVHINTPHYGKCVAAKVIGEYDFDEGLETEYGVDYRHCFKIDTVTIEEFDRRDPNIKPAVNLNPRKRYHRVYAVEEFLESIDNLRNNKVQLKDGERREDFHLKQNSQEYLLNIVSSIQENYKGKDLERFMAKVFWKVPGVVDVRENGSGWKSDYGADLIVKISTGIDNLELENKLIIQIKSYKGKHHELNAIDQIKTGIEEFKGSAGMLITTAQKTRELEEKILEVSDDLNKPIGLLSGEDFGKFVIKHAPELLFDID